MSRTSGGLPTNHVDGQAISVADKSDAVFVAIGRSPNALGVSVVTLAASRFTPTEGERPE